MGKEIVESIMDFGFMFSACPLELSKFKSRYEVNLLGRKPVVD